MSIEVEQGEIFIPGNIPGVLDLNLDKSFQERKGEKLSEKVFQYMDELALIGVCKLQERYIILSTAKQEISCIPEWICIWSPKF